ncbi:amphoterin-induced protein 1-like [Mytilus edulis]|uniref:amphoterin-induced protein 1-like n=1 Tax=Mytilus edulis TaxID=6550 RepID=UPI0039F0AADC
MIFCQFLLFLWIIGISLCVLPNHCDVALTKEDVRCNCSSKDLTHITTDCPSNTTDLDLSDNNLEIISKKAFTKFTQLRYLDLGNCHVTSIDQSAFDNLTHLKELSLLNNPMKTFVGNIFAPLGKLQVLHISYDLLSKYPRESWSDVLHLTKVFTYGGSSNG